MLWRVRTASWGAEGEPTHRKAVLLKVKTVLEGELNEVVDVMQEARPMVRLEATTSVRKIRLAEDEHITALLGIAGKGAIAELKVNEYKDVSDDRWFM